MNEANARKQRKPITQPETYKPPSGKYSNGLESLDDVISTFVCFGVVKERVAIAAKRGATVTGEIATRRQRDENGNSKYTTSGKHPRVQF